MQIRLTVGMIDGVLALQATRKQRRRDNGRQQNTWMYEFEEILAFI
jgi:hypothetical protein